MTAKKKYYYLFTSILFFNILGVLFDTFFSQKLWDKQALDKFREIKMRIEAVCTHRNHHVNKALNKLMCRIIKTVMNYQN